MKWTLFVLLVIMFPLVSSAQEKGQSKIIVTLPDSTDSYDKVKNALLNKKFILDIDQKNVLVSQPREFDKVIGYLIAKAEIKGNTVELTGGYTLRKTNALAEVYIPNDFEKVSYRKGSHAWILLNEVADRLGGTISYSR